MDKPPKGDDSGLNFFAKTPTFSFKNFRREYDDDDDNFSVLDNYADEENDERGAACGLSAAARATDCIGAPFPDDDNDGDDVDDLNDDPGASFVFSPSAACVHDTGVHRAPLLHTHDCDDSSVHEDVDGENDSPDGAFGFSVASAASTSAADFSRAPFHYNDGDNVGNSADLENDVAGVFCGFSAAASSSANFRTTPSPNNTDNDNNADVEDDIPGAAFGFGAAARDTDFNTAPFADKDDNGDNSINDNVDANDAPGGAFGFAAAANLNAAPLADNTDNGDNNVNDNAELQNDILRAAYGFAAAAAAARGFNTASFPDNNDDDEYDSDEEDVYKKRFHSSTSSSSPSLSKFFSEVGNLYTARRRSRYVERKHTEEDYSDEDVEQENVTTADSYAYDSENFDDEMEGWKTLPVILLEDIFAMLSPKQRHQASMVCRTWYEIFYSPRVWETFVLFERTLTKRRFNLYKGYQRELCPRKTQICLMRVGCFFKRIIITPISDYYNLYEFLRVLSSFLTFYAEFPMPMLHTFRFTFACESRGVNGVIIIGTGGNILEKLKDLVSNMQELRHLALNELLLDVEEVWGLLAAAATQCTESLTYLELLNVSKVPMPICEVCQFSQLLTLKLSPQHLSEEVVLLLGGTQLLHLHIVQDAYTCACDPVSSEAWKFFKDMAPAKRVFLEVQGLTKTPLLLQPHAPVRGVVFRTFYHRLQPELTTWIVEYYGKYLEFFVQECLPRAHGSRKFAERADESLLRLVRECPRLHTLVIRERLSLATLLLVAKEGKALRSLIVRRNALIKKCEWPRAKNWSEDFYRWLRKHGRDYELAFQQVPVLLKQRWKPAIDKVFKHTRVHVT